MIATALPTAKPITARHRLARTSRTNSPLCAISANAAITRVGGGNNDELVNPERAMPSQSIRKATIERLIRPSRPVAIIFPCFQASKPYRVTVELLEKLASHEVPEIRNLRFWSYFCRISRPNCFRVPVVQEFLIQ